MSPVPPPLSHPGRPALLPDRARLARWLLVIFAFSAWNLTGPAHIALFGLILLFLIELPGAGPRLWREPVLWLGLGALALTVALALRGAWLLPETLPRQWESLWEWASPFLFLVFAWFLRGDPRLIRATLIAGLLGLIVGVLRKSDWSLLGEVLGGMRYHFGQSALGIAFITSVALLGVILYVRPFTRLVWGGRAHPLAGTLLWLATVAFLIGMLLVLQARGAVVGLVAAGLALAVYRLWPRRAAGLEPRVRPRFTVLVTVALITALATAVIWTGRGRLAEDLAAFTPGPQAEAMAWTSSAAVRWNLWLTGLALFGEQPLLGWGPGTDGNKVLVPKGIGDLSAAAVTNAPQWSHMHSIVIEALVRFGITALVIALPLAWLLARAGRCMWASLGGTDPRLREFLALTALMTVLFVFYEYRLVHVDMRFFLMLFLGSWYSFWLHGEASPHAACQRR